jgi:hypothetical protein
LRPLEKVFMQAFTPVLECESPGFAFESDVKPPHCEPPRGKPRGFTPFSLKITKSSEQKE